MTIALTLDDANLAALIWAQEGCRTTHVAKRCREADSHNRPSEGSLNSVQERLELLAAFRTDEGM